MIETNIKALTKAIDKTNELLVELLQRPTVSGMVNPTPEVLQPVVTATQPVVTPAPAAPAPAAPAPAAPAPAATQPAINLGEVTTSAPEAVAAPNQNLAEMLVQASQLSGNPLYAMQLLAKHGAANLSGATPEQVAGMTADVAGLISSYTQQPAA